MTPTIRDPLKKLNSITPEDVYKEFRRGKDSYWISLYFNIRECEVIELLKEYRDNTRKTRR